MTTHFKVGDRVSTPCGINGTVLDVQENGLEYEDVLVKHDEENNIFHRATTVSHYDGLRDKWFYYVNLGRPSLIKLDIVIEVEL